MVLTNLFPSLARKVKEWVATATRRILMGKNLYVGNLSYSIKDDELNSIFAAYGKVASAQVIMDRETQRSKGFGFVEMPDDAEALAAIEALNGKEVNGRPLTVNEAKPREPRRTGDRREKKKKQD